MVGSYLTGWHTMSAWGVVGSAAPMFPDPHGNDATPPALTAFTANVAADGVFDDGDKDAVIRAIFIDRDHGATGPTVIIQEHGALITEERYFQALPGTNVPISFSDCNMHVPGGFQVVVNGTPFYTILYEILAKA